MDSGGACRVKLPQRITGRKALSDILNCPVIARSQAFKFFLLHRHRYAEPGPRTCRPCAGRGRTMAITQIVDEDAPFSIGWTTLRNEAFGQQRCCPNASLRRVVHPIEKGASSSTICVMAMVRPRPAHGLHVRGPGSAYRCR